MNFLLGLQGTTFDLPLALIRMRNNHRGWMLRSNNSKFVGRHDPLTSNSDMLWNNYRRVAINATSSRDRWAARYSPLGLTRCGTATVDTASGGVYSVPCLSDTPTSTSGHFQTASSALVALSRSRRIAGCVYAGAGSTFPSLCTIR